MKILVVTPPCYGKAPGAAEKDIYATIDHLKEMGNEVVHYAITPRDQDQSIIETFSRDHSVTVKTFTPEMRNWMDWIWRSVKAFPLVDRAAYVFALLRDNDAFKEFLEDFKPDAILTFCSYSWPILELAKEWGIHSVFRSHNFESNFYWESLDFKEKLLPSHWMRYFAKTFGEFRAVRAASKIATLPFTEVWHYERWHPGAINILTLTFPGKTLKAAFLHEGKHPLDVFYLGANYKVVFHLRGVRYLIEEIIPKVIRDAPGAFRFHICGSKLPEELVTRCDGKNVIYEGYVHDFEAFMDTMDIGAFPVKTGTTMKGKVFDSLARAFPMVVSTNSLGGYDLQKTGTVLVADTAEAFSTALISLTDESKRKELSERAHEFSQSEFGEARVQGVLRSSLNAA